MKKEIKVETKKLSKKAKKYLLVIAFLFTVAISYRIIDNTINWFRNNTVLFKPMIQIQWQKPIEFLSLKELEVRKIKEKKIEELTNQVVDQYLNPSPLPKCQNSVEVINPTRFFNEIRMKESTNGKNTNPKALHNYCKAKGKWNEIGYNPQNKFCFESEREAILFVAYYLEKNCKDMTYSQALCFWNTGKATLSCPYSEGNLSLAN